MNAIVRSRHQVRVQTIRRALPILLLGSLLLIACNGDSSTTDGGASCAKQCDCPASTVCSISGTCVGTPTVNPCAADGSCPCGLTCVEGFCPPFVGSLAPCSASCECGGETCVGGKCVAAASGKAGACTSDADCGGCGGTVCLFPDFPAMCAPPNRCTQDLHCLRHLGSGMQCVCSDGSTSHEECNTLGTCAAIPGKAFLSGKPLTIGQMPSGQCAPGETSTLVISGASDSPKSVLAYLEVSGVANGSSPPLLWLRGPGGEMAWSTFLFYQGFSQRLIEGPVTMLPASINGTWTLCNQHNPNDATPVVTKWGLYVQ